MSHPFNYPPRECNYCGENFQEWKDKYGDLFTDICKDCASRRSD